MKSVAHFLVLLLLAAPSAAQETEPMRLALARLTHDHVNWFFTRQGRTDIDLVGIYEPDTALRARYINRYDLPASLFYDDLEQMLDTAAPEAVSAFGSIREHREVVEAAAPRGIHVMVEKPLAFRLGDALRMQDVAEQHGIHLITNYETTWYSSMQSMREIVRRGDLGPVRKIVVRDGHQGPQEIGVSDDFLAWLTDPDENGAGALVDFGCYGANLVTWLMDGAEPLTVTAVTQQIKPDIYPDVDDEATIILTYRDAQAIIQASWNWPFNRKDMHVYGRTGVAFAPNGGEIHVRRAGATEEVRRFDGRPAPYDDPFSYLAAVVHGDIVVPGGDLSSLENNVTVVRILDAARASAQTGRTVRLRP